MNKLPSWPNFAYVRRLFVLYAIVWLVAGVTALAAMFLRFAPLNVAIGMLIATTMVMTISTALRLTRTSVR